MSDLVNEFVLMYDRVSLRRNSKGVATNCKEEEIVKSHDHLRPKMDTAQTR